MTMTRAPGCCFAAAAALAMLLRAGSSRAAEKGWKKTGVAGLVEGGGSMNGIDAHPASPVNMLIIKKFFIVASGFIAMIHFGMQTFGFNGFYIFRETSRVGWDVV
jgi:hypothetical protein